MIRDEKFKLHTGAELREDRVRKILEALPDSVFVISEQGIIVDCITSLPQEDLAANGIAAGSSLGEAFNHEIAQAILSALPDAAFPVKWRSMNIAWTLNASYTSKSG